MRAAGISAWRFILPAALAALAVGAVSTLALHPLAAGLNGKYTTERAVLMRDYLAGSSHETWLKQSIGRQQIVIHAKSKNEDKGMLLKGISVFFYTLDKDDVPHFDRRIEADQAQLRNDGWVLSHVTSARPGGMSVQSESLTIPSSVRGPLGLQQTNGDVVSFWDLPSTIRRAEQAGLTATAYRLTLQQLLAVPLLYAAMAVLAAAFSLRLIRLGGLAGLAGSGVALGFGFFFFNAVCGALGRAGIVPTALAAWTPPLIALLSGLTLLCYTEDG